VADVGGSPPLSSGPAVESLRRQAAGVRGVCHHSDIQRPCCPIDFPESASSGRSVIQALWQRGSADNLPLPVLSPLLSSRSEVWRGIIP
jgi:hypothetical protein